MQLGLRTENQAMGRLGGSAHKIATLVSLPVPTITARQPLVTVMGAPGIWKFPRATPDEEVDP